MQTKATYVILKNQVILSKKISQDWREFQDDYEDYKTSLIPLSLDELLDYFKMDYKNEQDFPFGIERIQKFYQSNQFILTELGYIENPADLEWKFPWEKIERNTSDIFMNELQKELHEEHILFGKPIEVIARREDRDDIAVYLKDDQCIAFVHLTWISKPEHGKFPLTHLCLTKEEFYRQLEMKTGI